MKTMHRISVFSGALAALALVPAWSASAQTSAPATKPTTKPVPYTVVRYDENYRPLADQPHKDFFDPIKYMPLGSNPDFYLSLGGQARYRYEFFDNNNFGAGPQDDNGFSLYRFFGNADLHLGQNVRAYVMAKSALEDGRDGGPRPVDADDFDIDQGFLDLTLPMGDGTSVTIRGGRQYLLYGAQRLVSPLEWTNTRRTFDGVKATAAWNTQHSTDAFWARPVIVDKGNLNESSDDVDLFGLYHTWKIGTARRLEPFAFYYDREGPDAGVGPLSTSVDEQRYTVGARYAATAGNLSYEFEGDYQLGDASDLDISAWSFATEVGYTFAGVPTKPKPFIGFDIASGDEDPTDSDLGTHNQLYPLGHAYFGYIDVIGRQNIMDLHPGLTLNVCKDVTFRGDYHMFWRQSDEDAVYNAAGGVLRADSGSSETYVGTEADLLITWQVDRHLGTYLGFSYFWAGDFIQDTGPDDDITFFYAAATYTF
jgi:hypothetical protein